MKGSGGMYEAPTPQEVVLGEFNYLIDCLRISHDIRICLLSRLMLRKQWQNC
ncbi:MAG: hypothetical protein ACLUVG_11000 [Phocaeicola vulgatus]